MIRHYQGVEDLFGRGAFNRDVVYADAISWKATPSPRLDAVGIRYGADHIRRIVETLRPRLVVPLGADAGRLLGFAPATLPHLVRGSLGDWDGLILPLSHPNKRHKGVGSKTPAIAGGHAAIASLLADTSPRSCSDV